MNDQSFTVIPYVEVQPNKSMCRSGDYTHTPLIGTCDVMPLLSQSKLNHAFPLCSVVPNCSISNCQLSSPGNATIEVKLYSCYDPPAIDITVYDSAGIASIATGKTSESKTVSNVVDGNELLLNVTVVQHTSNTLVGVQVWTNYG